MDIRPKKQPSIFLSHSSEDKAFVASLAADMRDANVRVWQDEAEIKVGDSLIDKIERGISESDYLGVVLSVSSVASEWVQREVRTALTQEIAGRSVRVLPLVIDDVEIPPFLLDKLYLDFREEGLYQAQLQRLLDRLGVAFTLVEPRRIRSLLVDGMKKLERLYEQVEDGEAPASTGFTQLDEMSVRFRPGSVLIVAGAPAHAVDTFANTAAIHLAEASCNVLSIVPGGNELEIVNRIMSSASKVKRARLETGTLRDTDWTLVSGALGRLADTHWSFLTDRAIAIDDIDRVLRRSSRKGDPTDVVLFDSRGSFSDATRSQAALSRQLKDLARSHNICVVVLAAIRIDFSSNTLGRPSIASIDPPNLADLADSVLLIAADQEVQPDRQASLAVTVARNEYGPWGTITLRWDPECHWCGEIEQTL